MNWLKRYREQPRSTLFRRVLFQLHLWTGLGVGAYLALMGLTGASLVFHEQWEHLAHPEFYRTAEHPGATLSLRQALQKSRALFPQHKVTIVYLPTPERASFLVHVNRGERVVHAYLHPVTGELLGVTDPARFGLRWLQDLHFNLLSGKTGRAVNGGGGLCLVLMSLSGLILWWPGPSRWRRATRVDFSRSAKRMNWDLHNAGGFWAMTFLFVMGVTGTYFGFAVPLRRALNTVSPLSFVDVPKGSSGPAAPGHAPKMEDLVEQARQLSPQAKLAGIQLPAGKANAFIVYMAREQMGDNQTTDYLYFDRNTGKLLFQWRRGISRSAGDSIVQAMVPLHFGTWGGVISQGLWMLLGFALPMLFVTGCVMWGNRVLLRWRRERRVGAGQTDAPLRRDTAVSVDELA